MSKQLWTEKYRPKTIDGYVFRDTKQLEQIKEWISSKNIPHLLFSGSAGIGKTTLAKILINELEVHEYDILEMNASRENRIDDMRDKITNFVQMIPFGNFRVVLLDEADYLTPASQAILRGLMETYATNSRFILTCNYPHKIIPALHSRCQGFHMQKVDINEFTARAATILVEEQIHFELDTLDTFVKSSYPDLRKCINMLSQNSSNGKLVLPSDGESASRDWELQMVQLFKEGKLRAAREVICANAQAEEIIGVFRWMYDNIDLFGKDDTTKDTAILTIKQGIIDHAICADPEINLSACLVKLIRLQS